MHDRRSQRIRENFKQRPNPRARTPLDAMPFNEQIRRVYAPAPATPSGVDHHAELARQLTQRKARR